MKKPSFPNEPFPNSIARNVYRLPALSILNEREPVPWPSFRVPDKNLAFLFAVSRYVN